MKFCKRCEIIKPLSEFYVNKTKRDGLQAHCKKCCNQYSKNHYTQNIQSYVTKAKRNSGKYKEEVNKLKESSPCVDCGKSYPYYVMDFDHRDPSKKTTEVSKIRDRSRTKVLEEIAKCDLVCANCHRERTYGPSPR